MLGKIAIVAALVLTSGAGGYFAGRQGAPAASASPSVMSVKADADPHAGHGAAPTAAKGEAAAPSTIAFVKANQVMHDGMAVPFTGDADVDFVRSMVAHHEGAVDMAEIVLEHGKDPEVRDLATAIISAQQAEIEFMRNWLARKAPKGG
jgi:uncharacterized protein (DUF305 family)